MLYRDDKKKMVTRLRELFPMTRDSQDAGSRNLGFAFFTVPVVVRDLHLSRSAQDVKLVVIITLKCAIMSPLSLFSHPRPISDYHMALWRAHCVNYSARRY